MIPADRRHHRAGTGVTNVVTSERIEAAAAAMYGKGWDSPEPAKRPGENMKKVWRKYAADAINGGFPELVADTHWLAPTKATKAIRAVLLTGGANFPAAINPDLAWAAIQAAAILPDDTPPPTNFTADVSGWPP